MSAHTVAFRNALESAQRHLADVHGNTERLNPIEGEFEIITAAVCPDCARLERHLNREHQIALQAHVGDVEPLDQRKVIAEWEANRRKAKEAEAKRRELEAAEDIAEAEPAPRQPRATPPKRPTCQYTTKYGEPCSGRAMLTHGKQHTYCTDHRPPHLHLTQDEIKEFDRMLESVGGTKGIIALLGWGQVRQLVRNSDELIAKAQEAAQRE